MDFAEGAFEPFRDSIEQAAASLARYDVCIRSIKDTSSDYTALVKGPYEGTPPQFPIAYQSVGRLSVGTTTAQRMEVIVRKAQRDFQFASIYNQRKTNQILVKGFTNLAQALEGVELQMSASIDDLAGSVNESMRAIQSRVGQTTEVIAKEASETAARQRKALEMLNNIQHGRRPFP